LRSTNPDRSASRARMAGPPLSGFFQAADQGAEAPQAPTDRHSFRLEAEEQQCLGTEKGVADETGEVIGFQASKRTEAGCRLLHHLVQKRVPAGKALANRRR